MKLLKGILGCSFAAAVLCCMSGKVGTVNAAELEHNRLYFSCAVNDGVNPGFVPANECEEISSDAFFVSGDTIFVDDTVNHRIIIYKNGSYSSEIPLDWNMDVKLLHYDSDNDLLKMVYLDLNADDATHLFLASAYAGKGQLEAGTEELSNADRVLLEYCFDQDGELLTQYQDAGETVTGINLASEEQFYDSDDTSKSSQVFSTDKEGQSTASIVSSYTLQGRTSIVDECIFINEGDETVAYAMPESHEGVLSRGHLQNADDGSLYHMVVSNDGIQIFQLAKNDIDDFTEQDMLQRTLSLNENDGIQTASSSYKNITTTTVKNRMDKYYKLSWTFNNKKNAVKSVTANPQYVELPGWLSKYSDNQNHSVTNVPYCWGGWNAETFISNINAGKFAGNVCTSSSGYVSGTVGMDCSGFVSVAFDLPYKHGTSTLSNCFSKVANGNVAAYNIMNKAGSHVKIVTKVYTSNGTKYIDTYEESSSSGKIVVRTGNNYQTLLNNGYIPMRYNYIQ